MSFRGIADPAQLAVLAATLDAHCKAHSIAHPLDREDVAIRIVALFGQGISSMEDLLKALDRSERRRA